jgi:hypothetical protein
MTSFSTTRTVLEGKVVVATEERTHMVAEVEPATLVPTVPAGKVRVAAFRRVRPMTRSVVPGPGAAPVKPFWAMRSGEPSAIFTVLPGSSAAGGITAGSPLTLFTRSRALVVRAGSAAVPLLLGGNQCLNASRFSSPVSFLRGISAKAMGLSPFVVR